LPSGRVPGSVAPRVTVESKSADDASAISSQLLLGCGSRRDEEMIEVLPSVDLDATTKDEHENAEEDEQ